MVRELADEVADPRGDETWDRWLSWVANFRNYSPQNCAAIMQQCSSARWVMGMKAWNRKFGAWVRRGSTGIRIWCPAMQRQVEVDPDTGQQRTFEFRRGWRTLTVFDMTQTSYDGPIPNFKRDLGPDTRPLLDAVLAFARSGGVACDVRPLLGSLNGYAESGRIILNEHNVEGAVGVAVQTAVHESAHILLGHVAPERLLPRAVVEGEAEACCVVVMRALGYDVSANGAQYIRAWGGGTETVISSLSRICGVARTIVKGIQANLPAAVQTTVTVEGQATDGGIQ
jgi:hypothetical protein